MARQGGDRSPASSSTAGAKTRRSHRKSRNGCSECKRRHIRCDEGRPSCMNCTMAERACSFPGGPSAGSLEVPLPSPGAHGQGGHSPGGSSSAGSKGAGPEDPPMLTPQGQAQARAQALSQDQSQSQSQAQSLPSFNESFADAAPPSATPAASPIGPAFTPQHLVLLHHVEKDMSDAILGIGATATVVDIAIRHAVECPYLIDQLLAFSAMHLAHQRPEQAAAWRHQATELQTRGLAYFAKETERAGDVDYAGPRFLFAVLLSLHMLTETLAYHRADFDLFLGRFIEVIYLHRGILYIVRPQYQNLLQSELQPILSLTQMATPRDPSRGSECKPLAALVDSALANGDLTPAGAAACHEAAHMLQWAFDLRALLPNPDCPHAVSGFSVVVPPEFVDVLREHRPEALVILAYYGVLLHRTRTYWVCGRSGAYMISAIAQQLGPRWQNALRWPLEVLEKEYD